MIIIRKKKVGWLLFIPFLGRVYANNSVQTVSRANKIKIIRIEETKSTATRTRSTKPPSCRLFFVSDRPGTDHPPSVIQHPHRRDALIGEMSIQSEPEFVPPPSPKTVMISMDIQTEPEPELKPEASLSTAKGRHRLSGPGRPSSSSPMTFPLASSPPPSPTVPSSSKASGSSGASSDRLIESSHVQPPSPTPSTVAEVEAILPADLLCTRKHGCPRLSVHGRLRRHRAHARAHALPAAPHRPPGRADVLRPARVELVQRDQRGWRGPSIPHRDEGDEVKDGNVIFLNFIS
jgi:hypothetical protein